MWWVLAPFWGGLVFMLLLLALVIIFKIIAEYYDDYQWKRRYKRRK